MPCPKQIDYIRHAEHQLQTAQSPDELMAMKIGTNRSPITARGRTQSTRVGAWLASNRQHYDVVFCSRYLRSKQTAMLALPGAALIEDERLNERNRGVYHALTGAQIAERYPEETERLAQEGYYQYCPPGGENGPMCQLRLRSWLETLRSDYANARVCVFAHGTLQVLLDMLLEGFDVDEHDRRISSIIPNCGIVTYRGDASGKLVRTGSVIVPWDDTRSND